MRAENANGQGAATPSLRAVPVHPEARRNDRRDCGRNLGHELVRLTWSAPDYPNVHHPVTSYQYRQSTNGGSDLEPGLDGDHRTATPTRTEHTAHRPRQRHDLYL